MHESGEIQLDEQRIAYTVARSRRRRRTIGFVMDSPSTLRIMAPVRASLSSIHSVLQRQKDWMRRRLRAFKKRADLQISLTNTGYLHGAEITYLGRIFRLHITHDQGKPQGCSLQPHRIFVNLHDATAHQEDIRLEIMLWLKKRAKVKFQRRMNFWARRLGVSYHSLVISKPLRRWGSCSADNVIRLNWRLIMAPLPVLDYVAVHELCHVKNKNHGPRFWSQVASVMPDWKCRRRNLRFLGDGFALG